MIIDFNFTSNSWSNNKYNLIVFTPHLPSSNTPTVYTATNSAPSPSSSPLPSLNSGNCCLTKTSESCFPLTFKRFFCTLARVYTGLSFGMSFNTGMSSFLSRTPSIFVGRLLAYSSTLPKSRRRSSRQLLRARPRMTQRWRRLTKDLPRPCFVRIL